MTGYGATTRQDADLRVAIEVRTVNNRYLKIVTKCPDSCASLESRIERLVRKQVSRGTATVTVRLTSAAGVSRSVLDEEVLSAYVKQLEQAADRLGVSAGFELSGLLGLPGVIRDEPAGRVDADTLWQRLEPVLADALAELAEFRQREGQSTEADLRRQCTAVTEGLDAVAARAPQVVVDHRDRLVERVRDLLEGTSASVTPEDLIREVSLFAERCDINEELSRMQSHLDQFDTILSAEISQGRKLEFLAQEMFREVNTIGSKANDVEIAHRVVEIKSAVDRIRENLQNVE